jgi:hypothetical protein
VFWPQVDKNLPDWYASGNIHIGILSFSLSLAVNTIIFTGLLIFKIINLKASLAFRHSQTRGSKQQDYTPLPLISVQVLIESRLVLFMAGSELSVICFSIGPLLALSIYALTGEPITIIYLASTVTRDGGTANTVTALPQVTRGRPTRTRSSYNLFRRSNTTF